MSDLFLTPVDYTIYAPDGSVVTDAIVRFDLTGNEPGLVGYWPMAYNAHR